MTWRALGYNDGVPDRPAFLFEPHLELRFDRQQYAQALMTALAAVGRPLP